MEERLTQSNGKRLLFSHDGIHDAETHLFAPPYFYEELEREIALSNRSGQSFAAVRVLFAPVNATHEIGTEKNHDGQTLQFAHALRELTRQEDCVARLGINECVILARANSTKVDALISRLLNSSELTVDKTVQISISSIEYHLGEKAREYLKRLDAQPLSTHNLM
jgi:GGDEF domain-containing protein